MPVISFVPSERGEACGADRISEHGFAEDSPEDWISTDVLTIV